MKRIKSTWDPRNLFNPGKIVEAVAMDQSLRYESDNKVKAIETLYNFESTGGQVN